MPDLFGLDIKGIVADALSGQLVSGTLTEVQVGVRAADSTEGRAQVAVDHAFEGIIDDYTDREIFGTSIEAGDRRVLIITGLLATAVVPEPNWRVTIEGSTYRVIAVKRDPAEATYTLQVRGE